MDGFTPEEHYIIAHLITTFGVNACSEELPIVNTYIENNQNIITTLDL